MATETKPPVQLIHRRSGDASRTQTLGPYRIETLLDRAEEGAGTAYRVHVPPGERTNISYHKIAEEYYFILAGSGQAILDGQHFQLAQGDFVRLPPGTTHGFIAGAQGLDMLDIHFPSCRPDHDVYFVDEIPQGFQTAR